MKGHCCHRNYRPNVTANGFAPMVVWTHGCSGSSAALIIARDLANLGDRPAWDCGTGYELMADIAKGRYPEKDMTTVLKGFWQTASNAGRVLLFKGETHYAEEEPSAMKYLANMHSKIVLMKRSNALDVAICAVHDCFNSMTPHLFGYAVTPAGQKTGGCAFRGREAPGNETESAGPAKVLVKTKDLLENLHHIMEKQSDSEQFLKDYHFNVDYTATSEDLFAYNWGKTGLKRSVMAWKKLMATLGVTVDYMAIQNYLMSLIGSHDPPEKRADIIQNIDEVRKAIDECEIPEDKMAHTSHKKKREFRTASWCAKVKAMLRGPA